MDLEPDDLASLLMEIMLSHLEPRELDWVESIEQTVSDLTRMTIENSEFLESEKIEGKYYIGLYFVDDSESNTDNMPRELLLSVAVPTKVFFKESLFNVLAYLMMHRTENTYASNLVSFSNLRIDILQFFERKMSHVIDYGPFAGARVKYSINSVVVKTRWLRLVQRRWRALLQARAASERSIRALLYREIHGRYPASPHKLRGMLADLAHPRRLVENAA